MPEGNRGGKHKTRLIIGAAIALAAVVILGLVAVGFCNQAGYYQYAADKNREFAQYAGQKASEACRSVSASQLANCRSEASVEAEGEKRSYEHDQADLIAQRKAALWAEMMGIAALLGMGLSIVGVVLVYVTFRATREANTITREANAAIVRPHIAIGKPTIEFDNSQSPTIRLSTRNASAFTAHDWEWQPLLKYRVGGREEFKSTLSPWFPRGVRGVDLPPDDQERPLPLAVLNFPLSQLPADHIAALENGAPFQISMTIFTRCFDALGNAVEDEHHFVGIAHNVVGNGPQYQIPLERVPAGTQIEGQEDKIPQAPSAS